VIGFVARTVPSMDNLERWITLMATLTLSVWANLRQCVVASKAELTVSWRRRVSLERSNRQRAAVRCSRRPA